VTDDHVIEVTVYLSEDNTYIMSGECFKLAVYSSRPVIQEDCWGKFDCTY